MLNAFWSSKLFRKDSEENQIKDALRNNVLFDSLTSSEISILSGIVHVRKYQVGEYVFHQHQPAAGMYIIVRGRVAIQVERLILDEETEEEKQENILITKLDENDFFGELALVDDSSVRSAGAKVIEPATLIGFFKPDLVDIMDTRPVIGQKIAFKIAEVLGKRLVETTHELAKMEFSK